MAKALLIIDYTNDFVADKGSLTVGKPAQTLAPEIMRLADQFLSQHENSMLPAFYSSAETTGPLSVQRYC